MFKQKPKKNQDDPKLYTIKQAMKNALLQNSNNFLLLKALEQANEEASLAEQLAPEIEFCE